MGHIVIYIDAEEGHILSTLELSTSLVKRGHRVTYLSLRAAQDLLQAHGFEFIPIFDGLCAPGATSAEQIEQIHPSMLFRPLLRGEALDSIVSRIKPTVFLTLTIFSLEAIVLKYRYNLPVVILRSSWPFIPRRDILRRLVIGRLLHLRAEAAELIRLLEIKTSIKSFSDIADLFLLMPELVLWPREFAANPEDLEDSRLHCLSPGVDFDRVEQRFSWESIDCERPLIYCALGSQSYLAPKLTARLLQVVLRAFIDLPEYQLIVAAGKHHHELMCAPSRHIHITGWAPQIEILRRADLVITHGGSGTMRECIAAGVPIVVIPLMRDQFSCADKIARSGIGARLDISVLTAEMLKEVIARVLVDRDIKRRVVAMRNSFLRSEWAIAVEVIEQSEEPT